MVLILTAASALTILFMGAVRRRDCTPGLKLKTGNGMRALRQSVPGLSSEHGLVRGIAVDHTPVDSAAPVEYRSMNGLDRSPGTVHARHLHLDHHSLTVPQVDAIAQLLHQLALFLSTLTDQQYTTSPVGPMSSSIGGHIRHNLDHIRGLVVGIEQGAINYDARERGTAIETSRHAALNEMRSLEAKLRGISALMLPQPIALQFLPAADAEPITVTTTIGRELAFVQSHTIHHNAMIATMASLLGVSVPPRFGYAPATLAFVDQAACVPSPSSR